MLTTSPPSVNRLSTQNVGASTSHNPMGLHGLLQGHSFTFLIPEALTAVTRMWRRTVWYVFTEVSEECAASIFRVEDGGGIFLRNIGKHLLHCQIQPNNLI
jgi:hypothetical protein